MVTDQMEAAMSQYTPTTGTIVDINWRSTDPAEIGCGLMLTLQSQDQGIVNILVDGSTYVFHNTPLNTGDTVTCFYSTLAPIPLIYPPQYQGVAIVHTPAGVYAALDTFTQSFYGRQLVNSDDTLRLNLSNQTQLVLPNGQPFGGVLSGKLLLVIYGATTRSIPAQTTPDEIVVFCGDTV